MVIETKGLRSVYQDDFECFTKLQHRISYFYPLFMCHCPSFLPHVLSSIVISIYYLQMLEQFSLFLLSYS